VSARPPSVSPLCAGLPLWVGGRPDQRTSGLPTYSPRSACAPGPSVLTF
jgi:hypothetical protein